MALSKLAISLIAGISGVIAVGGITAGVVVSKQNTTQVVEPSFDERNMNDKSDEKSEGLSKEENEKRSSSELEMMHGDDPLVSNEKDKSSNGDEEDLKKKAEQEEQEKMLKAESERRQTLSASKQPGSTPAKGEPKVEKEEHPSVEGARKQEGNDPKTHEQMALGNAHNQSPAPSGSQADMPDPALSKQQDQPPISKEHMDDMSHMGMAQE